MPAFHRPRLAAVRGALLLALAPLAPSALAQVSLTTLGVPYTQSFDTLPASGSATWTNNSTVPGWFHARTGTGATIVANDGSSNAGNLYSYGTGTATDRAVGSIGSGNAAVGNLFYGVRLQNNTGATITQLDVSYSGEQWRNSAAAAQTVGFSYLVGSPTVTGSLAEFQSAGVAVPSLDFTAPITGGTAGALNGNLAANRVVRTFSITGLNIANGTEVMLRWSDPDHTGADHGLSIDDFSVTPQGGVPTPALNVSDVTATEGDPPGTTTFSFAVTLTSPAGPGGVTFDIATADGTAQDGNPGTDDTDYVAQSLTGQAIPMGSTGPFNFDVTVNRDTVAEPNETFFVNVTNLTGATAGDVQGQGTINNDDVTLTPIHDIQGPGASSPIVGASVTTRGIVTGVRSSGFFLQEPDAQVDADPATSEGLFVFTGAAPPAAAVVGAQVQVAGTVTEFVPGADPLQPPLTELTSPTVVQLSTGNPLPAAIPLTSTFPDPAGPHDQLERLEGMRVSIASFTVGEATDGTLDEANATAASNGVFHGSVTGVPRAFREPGIQPPDPAPAGGSIPPIPRWDGNPEVLRVDGDGLVGGAVIDVDAGAVLTGLTGPLHYDFRRYTVLVDPNAPAPAVAGGLAATSVTPATAQEATLATINLQRFYDTLDDPEADVVLTPAAYDRRLAKASRAIRDHLRAPDVVGVVEVEKLSTLQDLAARINSDAVAAAQPDPSYDAYLVEGNGSDGVDVGFLVKSAEVSAGVPRVEVIEVVQELDGTLLVNPDSSTATLHDRPPLRLNAVVHTAGGGSWPVTAIVNHLRSLNGVDDESAGTSGWPTEGARIRAKRQEQAEDLANLVQSRQTADPAERIVLLGDFNAFEFNDGLVDVLNVLAGTPPPDNETAVPGDGIDLVNPDLDVLSEASAAERYSFVFGGSAQSLDHVLVNAPLAAATPAPRIEHARINADFRETDRNDGNTARRVSDHDPVVAYFSLGAPGEFAFSAANYDVGEATTSFDVTVVRTGGSFGAVDVSFDVAAGTAQAADFVAATGTVSFADGETSKTFPVTLVNDAIDEPDQTLALSLSNPTNGGTLGAPSAATLTIQDDDAAPTITIDDLNQAEGTGGSSTATLTATLSAASEFSIDLSFVFTAGTAGVTDYSAADGSVTFAPGALTQTIPADIAGDAIFEADETLFVDLTGATNAGIADAQGTITIANDDAAPTLSVSDVMHPEGTGGTSTATVVVTVSGATELPIDLNWSVNAGSATCCGDDFTGGPGAATIPAGVASLNIDATIVGDALDEPNETVLVDLTGATNATIADAQGVITLVDDDGAPQLVIDDLSVNEGDAGTTQPSLTVTLVGATAQTVTVSWNLVEGSASCCADDFSGPDGILTFLPGVTTQTIGVAVFGDVRFETDETVLVDLSAASNATIADAQGVFTILNDDAAPVFTISDAAPAEGDAGSTAAILTVTKTGATDLPASVDFSTAPAGATAGVDYTAVAGTLNFPAATASLQISVPILGDTDVEGNEQVQVNLLNPAGATIGDAQGLLTIVDDDVAALPVVNGSKSVAGAFLPGGTVTYTIVLSNTGSAAQADNPGAEFTDVLPAALQLVSASATSGTAVATLATGTVDWNGSIPAAGSVTITITASIRPGTPPGTTVTNVGTIATDADGNGSNETTRPTDDPSTQAGGDGTGFVVGGVVVGAGPRLVPGLDEAGKLLLALVLALFAATRLRGARTRPH